jgi:hypothetical protein
VLVRAPLMLATARSAHNAIETALEEHPARTGQAERCRNQDSCERPKHENIFLSHSIPAGNLGLALAQDESIIRLPGLIHRPTWDRWPCIECPLRSEPG